MMPVMAFLIPCLILLFVFRSMNFYPFGTKSMLLYDMDSCLIQFYEAFKNLFKEGGSIFFSWSKSMGSPSIGLFAYHMSSPFNFIFLLFDDIQTGLFYMLLVKIASCGVTSYFFLRYTFRSNNTSLLILTTSYALMSYNIMYSQSPMWMDGVVFLPLILLGAEKIFRKEKPWLFIISLAVLILSNYYVAYMVCIFSVLYILYRYFTEYSKSFTCNRDIVKIVGKFIVGYAISIGLTLWMTLPVLFDLMAGKLNDSFLSMPGYSTNFPLKDYLNSFLPGHYTSTTNNGLPALYCGIIIGALCLGYFITNSISAKKKVFTLGLFAFMLASFHLTALDTAWHTFRVPNSFPYRYSFIFDFFAVFIACDFIVIHREKIKSFFNFKKISKPAITVAITIIPLIILIPVSFDLYNNTDKLLNGLNNQIRYIEASSYSDFRDENLPIIENIQRSDDSLYRIEKTYQRTINDALALNYKGISHYSSIFKRDFLDFTKNIGFSQGWYWNSYFGSTPVTDSLFGVKYILSRIPMPDSYNIVDFSPDTTKKISDTVKVYENPYVLPIAFMTNLDYPDINFVGNNYFIIQNTFLNKLSNTTKPCFIPERNIDKTNESLEYTFVAAYDYPVYIYYPEELGLGGRLYVNGEYIKEYLRNDDNYTVCIGQFDIGTEVKFSFSSNEKDVRFKGEYVYYLDTDEFSAVTKQLAEGGLYNISYNNAHITGEVNAAAHGIMFTSIPYDAGFSVKVDGSKVETFSINKALLAFNVPEGHHSVEIDFTPQGFVPGAAVSGICLVIILLYASWIYYSKRA